MTNITILSIFRTHAVVGKSPSRTENTIVTEVGLRRMTVFGTGFYNLINIADL